MKWRYRIRGPHTQVKVFMNGAHCGELIFRNAEFLQIIKDAAPYLITFTDEDTEDDYRNLPKS